MTGPVPRLNGKPDLPNLQVRPNLARRAACSIRRVPNSRYCDIWPTSNPMNAHHSSGRGNTRQHGAPGAFNPAQLLPDGNFTATCRNRSRSSIRPASRHALRSRDDLQQISDGRSCPRSVAHLAGVSVGRWERGHAGGRHRGLQRPRLAGRTRHGHSEEMRTSALRRDYGHLEIRLPSPTRKPLPSRLRSRRRGTSPDTVCSSTTVSETKGRQAPTSQRSQ